MVTFAVQTRREQAAPQQFEQARLRSVCTVLAEKLEVMADIKAEYLACPIRQVVSRFGDKWSMLVLYMLHTSERQRVGDQGSGMTGVLRFNEIRRLMTDCSQKMLSQTLKNLEQSHLVHTWSRVTLFIVRSIRRFHPEWSIP